MTGRDWVLADAFDRAAPTYDAMVALSPGYHHQLRAAAASLFDRLPPPDGGQVTVLDLGCGSGASTRALLDTWTERGGATSRLSLTGVDASEGDAAQIRGRGSHAADVTYAGQDHAQLPGLLGPPRRGVREPRRHQGSRQVGRRSG